jgi:thymidylate synthase
MTILADRYAMASSVSEGWLDALHMVRHADDRKLVHGVIRITDPAREDASVRAAAQELIDQVNGRHEDAMWDVETTRNTIFPTAWARRYPEPADLSEYYRSRYADLRRVPANGMGTYFGRIVAYPHGADKHKDTADQLTNLVRKLREEFEGNSHKSSRYEVNIFSEWHDTATTSFPCLGHLSFHVYADALHMQAVYRNEVIVGRAYGNYLGLAELQTYIASAANLKVGELLMCVNHAELDSKSHLAEVDNVLGRFGDRVTL